MVLIEKIVRDYLAEQIDRIPVYLELPQNIPPRYIVIQKTGSSRRNRLRSAVLAVQSIGRTLADAAAINEMVINAMDGIVEMPEVSACYLNSDYMFSNTATKERRYQAVFNVTHY